MTAHFPPIKVTILGSGTSAGVPMIGCHCAVCESPDPKDKRTRSSIVVHYHNKSYLIDTGPELRLQAIAARLDRIDAVIYTHAHADHIFGLDDIRRYNTIIQRALPVYARAETMSILETAFPYAFVPMEPVEGLYRPELEPHLIDGPFDLDGLTWTPLPMPHGRVTVQGFRIGNFAYCTDCAAIGPQTRALMQNLDVLIIDALRPRPHPTHLSFSQAREIIADLKPKCAYFTHINHEVKHADIERDLPPEIHACYDGLEILI